MLMGHLIEEGPDIFIKPMDDRTNDYITGRFG
jgi:ABC-type phosphate transport system ATPase subunit